MALPKLQFLDHPLTRGMDIDDPRTTELRRRIIAQKGFLRKIYVEWYERIAAAVGTGGKPALELGSGGGFLEEYVPNLLTSEIFPCAGVKLVLDGQRLPFAAGSLRGIAMVDVLHHLPRAREFFGEAVRCLEPGGRIALVEPWNTWWSRFVYGRFHHEAFDAQAGWELRSGGPLSGANGALPWIILERDRAMFEREFPELEIEVIRPMMPVRYLLSGGVSRRSLMPGFMFGFWRGVEGMLEPWRSSLGMFAFIQIRRREEKK